GQGEGGGRGAGGGGRRPGGGVGPPPGRRDKEGISCDGGRSAPAPATANRPRGGGEEAPRRWQIQADDQAHTAREYAPLILAWRDGAAVRLGDVAEVVDSVQDVRNAGLANGKPSVLLILFRQPNANIIPTADHVRAELPMLR